MGVTYGEGDTAPVIDELTLEETTETPTEAVDHEPYLDRLAKEVLQSIKAGDYKKVAEYMMATDDEAL